MSEAERAPSGRRRGQSAWWRAEIALWTVVVFCPLAIGTVHAWAIAAAAGLALAALLLAVLACLRAGEAFELPAPALSFAVVTAFVALQLVPLPPFAVGLVAPTTRGLFEFILAPLGAYPAWRPLSLDPPATLRELAKAITCLAVFLAAAQVVRSRRARSRAALSVGVAALCVAVIGFGHQLVGARSLFGLFTFEFAGSPFFTTVGNPNHLASLLTTGACALLARVLVERDRKVATLWGIAYLAAGVGVLLTLSRGGIVVFLASQLMLASAWQAIRRSEKEGVAVSVRAFVAPAAVLGVLAVASYLAFDAIIDELASADSLDKLKASKLSMWPSFLPLLRDHWLVGGGRGAFESTYQRFQDPAAHSTFTHAESILFQWAADLGVPMALGLSFACGRALVRGLKRNAGSIEAVACGVAVAAAALHDVVDFALEFGGAAVPATVAFAVAVAGEEAPRRLGRRMALAAVPAAAAVASLALWAAGGTLREDGEALQAKLGKVSADELASGAAAMARRHPADYFPQRVAAEAYAAERPVRPDKVVGFANRAMFLNPADAAPHRLAARALWTSGHRSQALIEYRLGYALGDRSQLGDVTLLFREPKQMAESVPQAEGAQADLMDELLRQGRIADAAAVGELATGSLGETAEILERQGRIAAAQNRPDEVARIGGRIDVQAPSSPRGILWRAHALEMQGKRKESVVLLESEGLERFPTTFAVVIHLAELKLSLNDTRGARAALKRLQHVMGPGERVTALVLEARAAEQDGQALKALGFRRAAMNLQPDNDGLRWETALLLERLGRLDEAVREAEHFIAHDEGLKPQAEALKNRCLERKRKLEEMQLWKDLERPDGG